jgi:hypothetical protein
MLAMIDSPQHPDWIDPEYWAPFVVVGEPPNRIKSDFADRELIAEARTVT